jgi:sorbitol-specific phosphotransferase system component IIBC
MPDILRPLLIIILLTISLAAYFLVIGTLFATRVEKTQRVIHQMPARAFGVGLVNFLFFGVIALVLVMLTNGENRVNNIVRVILLFPTIGVFAFLGILLSFGLTGMAGVIGERIFASQNVIKQNILGVVILSIACALPFAGWFLMLPYVGLVGIGAVILGFFQREN